jgi:hypothetical protein
VSGGFEEPRDGKSEFDRIGDGDAGREWIEEDQEGSQVRAIIRLLWPILPRLAPAAIRKLVEGGILRD